MPLKAFDEDDSKKDVGVWIPWKKDPDNGKLIRFRLRPIPPSFDKAARVRHNRGLKSENVGKRLATDIVERQIEATRDRALYALLDSENFEIEIGGESTAAAIGGLLNGNLVGAQVLPGGIIGVDGRWPQLGKYLLELMPPLAAWLSEKADELAKLEADEEEELSKI